MKLGRLGAWYSTDKLGGAGAIRDFARTLLRFPASFPTISPDR